MAVNNLKRENEELYTRLKQASDNERKVFEIQSKLGQTEREVERLGLNVKAREEEILSLRSRLREVEAVNQRYEFDAGKTKNGY